MIWFGAAVFLTHCALAAAFRLRGVVISFAAAPAAYGAVTAYSMLATVLATDRFPHAGTFVPFVWLYLLVYFAFPFWVIGLPGSVIGLLAAWVVRRRPR